MKTSVLTILFTLVILANSNILDGSYLLQLGPGESVSDVASRLSSGGVNVKHIYDSFNGLSVELKNPKQLEFVKSFAQIESIESDQMMHTCYVSQSGATWGLQRISQHDKVTGDAFTYRYETPAGRGVNAYVIDTGILTNHPEFEGRAIWGTSFVDNEAHTDLNGHGTHVAGTIGSKKYGVAKDVTLIAVKVLDASGSGSISQVIAGMDFAIKHCKSTQGLKGCVINMSLGSINPLGALGPVGEVLMKSLNDAVSVAAKANIACCVAAGNSNAPATLYSPASAPEAITVAASDQDDKFASFSNYGSKIDIIAPGVNILSTWNDGGTNTISGTSMATPHVTGLVAYFLGQNNLLTPDAVKQLIKKIATPDKISSIPFQWLQLKLADITILPQPTVNKIAFNDVA